MARSDEQTAAILSAVETAKTTLLAELDAAVTAETAQVLEAIAANNPGLTDEQMASITAAVSGMGAGVAARVSAVYEPSVPPPPPQA